MSHCGLENARLHASMKMERAILISRQAHHEAASGVSK
jgi:hypothetical protein